MESKSCDTIEDFDLILQEMLSTYKKKNADYGNSFAEAIQEFGFIPAVARISDKVKRMKNIVKGQKMNYDESLRDALMDAACYCVMTVVELDKKILKINKKC